MVKRIKKQTVLVLMLVIHGMNASAQNYVEIFKSNASTTAPLTFSNDAGQTRIHETSEDLSIPLKINSKSSFLTGLLYEHFNTKLFADGNNVNFSATTLKLGFNTQLNERLSATFVLLPKIAKDISSLDGRDFQFGGITIWKFRKTERLHYKYGLYFNQELFGPFFVPILGLYYQSPNKKFETNMLLPLQADAWYWLHKLLSIGVNFNGQIRSYHFSNLLPGHPDTYLARSTNEIFTYLRFDLAKGFSLYARAGMSVGRSYKIFDQADKVNFGLPATFIGPKRTQLNSNFSNGAIFQFSILYRIFPTVK